MKCFELLHLENVEEALFLYLCNNFFFDIASLFVAASKMDLMTVGQLKTAKAQKKQKGMASTTEVVEKSVAKDVAHSSATQIGTP